MGGKANCSNYIRFGVECVTKTAAKPGRQVLKEKLSGENKLYQRNEVINRQRFAVDTGARAGPRQRPLCRPPSPRPSPSHPLPFRLEASV